MLANRVRMGSGSDEKFGEPYLYLEGNFSDQWSQYGGGSGVDAIKHTDHLLLTMEGIPGYASFSLPFNITNYNMLRVDTYLEGDGYWSDGEAYLELDISSYEGDKFIILAIGSFFDLATLYVGVNSTNGSDYDSGEQIDLYNEFQLGENYTGFARIYKVWLE